MGTTESRAVIASHEVADGQPIYQLGRISFIVNTADKNFERQLPKVLPTCHAPQDVIHVVEASNDYRGLLMSVLGLQAHYLWLSAACAVSPDGHRVLISGHSNAGKSTTVLALAMRYGWKVVSEDITCIDLKTDRVMSIATPFSLKPGTIELLQETIAMTPEPVVFGEWVPLSDLHAVDEYEATFDLSLFFGEALRGQPLIKSPCSAGEYVRLLLPCSNLVHIDDGPSKLAEYVGIDACYRVTGGTLSERLALILALTSKQDIAQ